MMTWLNHQTDGPYWRAASLRPDYHRIRCPVFMCGGWLDAYRTATLRTFQHLSVPKKCLIGPWTHTQEGLASAGVREGLAWLRGHLLGDPRLMDTAAVRVFVTGDRAGWRVLEHWPPGASGGRRLWVRSTPSPAADLP